MRASTHALSLLATPLNVHVLRSLEEEPTSLIDLRRSVGFPPQTTMRVHLRKLTEVGVLERQREQGFPGSVDYALSRSGRQLAEVARVLSGWLDCSPQQECPLGTPAGKSVVKAVISAWSSGMLRALAARPLTLTDLSKLITSLNYPSLERRLGALRIAGLIEAAPSSGRGTPYQPTEWMRQAVGPLTSAAAWEREHLRDVASSLGRIDAEAAFLLAVPLLRLPEEVSGLGRLTVEVPGENGRRPAGVLVKVDEGRVTGCVARLEGQASGWASGSVLAWLTAVIEGDSGSLEVGGDCHLANSLVHGLNQSLFSGLAMSV